MARRRMFSMDIVDTDKFMDMPPTTQNLYFHLGMRADDDGFVSSPKKVALICGSCITDLQLLVSNGFIIPFDNGVILITDWIANNYIRKERYTETRFKEYLDAVQIENDKYITDPLPRDLMLGIPNDNQLVDDVYTSGCHRLGKDRIELGKDRIDINKTQVAKETMAADHPSDMDKRQEPIRHKYGEYKNVLLSDEDIEKLKMEFPNDWEDRIERLSSYVASTGKSYKNHLATIRNWARKDKSDNNGVNERNHGKEKDKPTMGIII